MARRLFRLFVHVLSLFLCVILGISIGLNFRVLETDCFEKQGLRKEIHRDGTKHSIFKNDLEDFPALERPEKVEPLNLRELLLTCDEKYENASFEQVLDKAMAQNKCTAPLTAHQFVCAAKCSPVEEELERTVRVMRTGNHSAEWLVDGCKKKLFPILIWISSTGRIRYVICIDEKLLVGPKLWRELQRLLFTVSCVVQISPKRDFLFGFDASDYSTPTYDAPYDLHHYINVLPGIGRFVGTSAHNPLLVPTSSHIVASGLCDWRNKDNWWRFCYENEDRKSHPFSSRVKPLMWRGLPTGLAWTESHWTFMQRLVLVRDFGNKKEFDVGFVRDVKRFANSSETLKNLVNNAWVQKPKIEKADHDMYAHLIHVDGNTASWGISHKLMTGSTLVWIQSQHDFREYFYHHLKPWVHYVPVAMDLSDLDAAQRWLYENPKEAERIGQNAVKLVKERLSPNHLFCYVYRLLASVAAAQQPELDPSESRNLNEKLLRKLMGDSTFRKFRDVADWKFHAEAATST